MFIFLPWTLLNCDYFFRPPPFPSPPLPSSSSFIRSLLAFAHCAGRQAGSGAFWLPAKLMSKCLPHATVIQISYFLPFLVQTSHPSRLSSSFTPSRHAPSFSFSVCCREASNEIHTKRDGGLDAFLSTFLCLFLPLFSVLLTLAALFSSLVLHTLMPSSCGFSPWRVF